MVSGLGKVGVNGTVGKFGTPGNVVVGGNCGKFGIEGVVGSV